MTTATVSPGLSGSTSFTASVSGLSSTTMGTSESAPLPAPSGGAVVRSVGSPPASLSRLFETRGEVAVAPGRGGGTNALVVRHPDFRVDYHGASYRDHRRIAADAGLSVGVVDSMRLATDVDEPDDIAEVLLHGEGRAREWLADAGFEVVLREGRVGVARSD